MAKVKYQTTNGKVTDITKFKKLKWVKYKDAFAGEGYTVSGPFYHLQVHKMGSGDHIFWATDIHLYDNRVWNMTTEYPTHHAAQEAVIREMRQIIHKASFQLHEFNWPGRDVKH